MDLEDSLASSTTSSASSRRRRRSSKKAGEESPDGSAKKAKRRSIGKGGLSSLQFPALGGKSEEADYSGRKELMDQHRSLKRKYNALVYEANELMDVAERHAHTNLRLLEQRNYLLDRLVAMEEHLEQHNAPPFDFNAFMGEQVAKRRRLSNGSAAPGVGSALAVGAAPAAAKSASSTKRSRSKKKADAKGSATKPKKEKVTCVAMDKGKQCTGKPLPSLKYCLFHAPLDPESNYQYCSFKKEDGWTCSVPVNRSVPSGLCTFHRKKAGVDVEPEDVKTEEVAAEAAAVEAAVAMQEVVGQPSEVEAEKSSVAVGGAHDAMDLGSVV